MKDVLVIGNKPYKQLPMDNLIDRFENNIRCGMVLPGTTYNCGTKFDKLGLCNHTWERLMIKFISRVDFVNYYKKDLFVEFLEDFYDFFQENKSKYTEIFHSEHKGSLWNQTLSSLGCPHRFTTIPRLGQDIIFENLLKKNKVFVTNFSLYEKAGDRWSYGAHWSPTKDTDPNYCHNQDDETNIMKWLHERQYIDVTLCMLEDNKVPTLKCKEVQPSVFIMNMLRKEYGDIAIIE